MALRQPRSTKPKRATTKKPKLPAKVKPPRMVDDGGVTRLWAGGIIIDTETTGLQPSALQVRAAEYAKDEAIPRMLQKSLNEGDPVKRYGDVITEIAAVAAYNGEVLFHSYVRPDEKYSRRALEIATDHGFPMDKLGDAPQWPRVWDDLIEAITGRGIMMLAWNAQFDQMMIEQMNARWGIVKHPKQGLPIHERPVALSFSKEGYGMGPNELKARAIKYFDLKSQSDSALDGKPSKGEQLSEPKMSKNYTTGAPVLGSTETAMFTGLWPWHDVMPTVAALLGKPARYGLERAMSENNVAYEGNAHNAVADCKAVAALLKEILRKDLGI